MNNTEDPQPLPGAPSPGPALGPRPARQHGRRTPRLTAAQTVILDHLSDQPAPCTASALATALHQHANTVREHLDTLVAAGVVERSRAAVVGRGRPAWLYSAPDAAGLSDDAREYASLATALASHVARTSTDPATDAALAGETWGRELARTSADRLAPERGTDADARRLVVEILDTLGFDPEPDTGHTTVRLRRCPLLAAAHKHPDVVCGVHLGLARGALLELGAPTDGTALLPFAERGACRLHLGGVR